jgi:hypothetical protein
MTSSATPRFSPEAFTILVLSSIQTLRVSEEIFHALAYLIITQIPEGKTPKIKFKISGMYLFSSELSKAVASLRRTGLIETTEFIRLTKEGNRAAIFNQEELGDWGRKILEISSTTIGWSRRDLYNLLAAAVAIATEQEINKDHPVKSLIETHLKYRNQNIPI